MASRALGEDLRVGLELAHYRVVEKIGAGGMGEVYRAHDEHLARDVAIKVLPIGTLRDESARKHFHKEALILSQLNHPNVATIYDFDTQQGVDFLVMEYIPGITLSEKVAAGPLPEKEVLRLGLQLAEGLAVAHDHGVVHRDLKPGNLRVTSDGRLKILDFGLAKLWRPVTASATTESLSETQAMAGTLPYMAPEQLLGEEIDARTDLHAAGLVLYEMATGRYSFAEVERSQLIGAILRQAPTPPGQLNPHLSRELERIIGKCLEKEAEKRYQSAKELAIDLQRLARGDEARFPDVERPGISGLAKIGRYKTKLAIVAAVAVLLGVAGIFLRTRMKPASDAARIPPSIAVLPFADMSPERNQEYFSDGLAEEVLNRLAQVPGLKVTGRTSSFQFKGKNEDLRVIGEKLNVATILEGSVRKQGNRVRITAELVKAADGFHLWSETYNRDLTDVFVVQDEIARSVAGSLKVMLLEGTTAMPVTRSTNSEVYSAYLQGQYFLNREEKEDVEKAIAYYEQTIKLDSGYAPAWVGLAEARCRQLGAGWVPAEEGYAKAREAAERALALDPNLADAHLVMMWIKAVWWDWPGADASLQRARALEPGNVAVVRRAAWLATVLGRFEEAVVLSRRAVELDILNSASYSILGLATYRAGRLEEAVEAFKKAKELGPSDYSDFFLARVYLVQAHPQEALAEIDHHPVAWARLCVLAIAYHALGRKKESDTALEELIAKHRSDAAYQIAEVYAFRGETDRAFGWLERAYAQHDVGLAAVVRDPLLKSLEHDPRYAVFLKKMGLPS
jgi:eukaryotic-like serine/threonine-protein kinase